MLKMLETELLRHSLSPSRNLPALYSDKLWNSFKFPLYALKRWLLVEIVFSVWKSCSWHQLTDAMHAVTRLNGLPLLHRTFGFHFPPSNQSKPTTVKAKLRFWNKMGKSLFNTTPNEIWWRLVYRHFSLITSSYETYLNICISFYTFICGQSSLHHLLDSFTQPIAAPLYMDLPLSCGSHTCIIVFP